MAESILAPSYLDLQAYTDTTRVQKHFEQQAQYFTIVRLGTVADPANTSFVHRDGFNALLLCEENPSTLQYGIQIDFTALIFEVTARIDEANCFLMPEGDCNHPWGSEEDKPGDGIASCWFTSPGDTPEEITAWRCALYQIERIVRQAADEDTAIGELIAPDYNEGRNSPLALLRAAWWPPRDYTLHSLPIFTADHQHLQIVSLAMVPFKKRVRVRFILRGVPAEHNRPAIVGAHLLYVHVLD